MSLALMLGAEFSKRLPQFLAPPLRNDRNPAIPLRKPRKSATVSPLAAVKTPMKRSSTPPTSQKRNLREMRENKPKERPSTSKEKPAEPGKVFINQIGREVRPLGPAVKRRHSGWTVWLEEFLQLAERTPELRSSVPHITQAIQAIEELGSQQFAVNIRNNIDNAVRYLNAAYYQSADHFIAMGKVGCYHPGVYQRVADRENVSAKYRAIYEGVKKETCSDKLVERFVHVRIDRVINALKDISGLAKLARA